MTEIKTEQQRTFSRAEYASEKKRRIGSYYTPDWIARAMIERACAGLTDDRLAAPWRMIDPACGDGAFVMPMLDWLARRYRCADVDPESKLKLVQRHVFGVDADPTAIATLRERVVAWIGFHSEDNASVKLVLESNFRCGDALLGQDWFEIGETANGSRSDAVSDATKSSNQQVKNSLMRTDGRIDNRLMQIDHRDIIDWPTDFSEVALDGGFDLVIGNPPYRRELLAKEDFERIATGPLGIRWKRPRMDLWHYFLHRGVNLLKPLSSLSFIVNSYWLDAVSARPVRQRLRDEMTMQEVIHFGSTRLFKGVSGRHMIFRAKKVSDPKESCRIVDLSEVEASQLPNQFLSIPNRDDVVDAPSNSITRFKFVSQSDFWRDRVATSPCSSSCLQLHQRGLPEDGPCLGDLFEVRQGIAENPPFVTRRMATELRDPALIGRGVFALTDDEIATLKFNEFEQLLLKPYYALPAMGRYWLAPKPTHWLLYLTRQNAPGEGRIPNIIAHLSPYRSALERRREVVLGTIRWWHLHWPREERLFVQPRVICIQMAHVPTLLFANAPTFVGFSTHVITNGSDDGTPRKKDLTATRPTLPSLCGLLNSSFAKAWFEKNAKHRGANLDISGLVLKKFPLPKHWNEETGSELDRLVHEAMTSNGQFRNTSRPKTETAAVSSGLEERLDQLVQVAYWA